MEVEIAENVWQRAKIIYSDVRYYVIERSKYATQTKVNVWQREGDIGPIFCDTRIGDQKERVLVVWKC